MGSRTPVLTFGLTRVAAVAVCVAVAAGACKIEQKPQPTHRGVYLGKPGGAGSVPGSEMNSFIPCGSDTIYWVEGPAKSALQSRYSTLARRPFQSVYVELKAQVLPRGNAAPMEGHQATIRIDTVLTATTQVPVECRPKVRPKD